MAEQCNSGVSIERIENLSVVSNKGPKQVTFIVRRRLLSWHRDDAGKKIWYFSKPSYTAAATTTHIPIGAERAKQIMCFGVVLTNTCSGCFTEKKNLKKKSKKIEKKMKNEK